jgi:hypothetical protein
MGSAELDRMMGGGVPQGDSLLIGFRCKLARLVGSAIMA